MKMSKFLLLFATGLLLITKLNAQKIYEFDEINKLPFVSKTDMKLLTINIVDFYKSVLSNPEKYSTDKASKEIVNSFSKWGGKYNKVERLKMQGRIYRTEDYLELQKNDVLYFNLKFNTSGKIIIPVTICVISCQEVYDSGHMIKSNEFSFEIPISSKLKDSLRTVLLVQVALKDINSLTGDLSPVNVVVPFRIRFENGKSYISKGTITKQKDFINITSDEKHLNDKGKIQLINLIKSNSDLLIYKKGQFKYEIETIVYEYNIDVNIARGGEWSRQPLFFNTYTKELKSFLGDGKKLK